MRLLNPPFQGRQQPECVSDSPPAISCRRACGQREGNCCTSQRIPPYLAFRYVPCSALFFYRKGQWRCTDLLKSLTSEFSSTSVFQQWPTSGCKIWQVLPDAFKYKAILFVEGLTYVWVQSWPSYKNFQQKSFRNWTKLSGNYFGMFSRSSVCPCAIISATAFLLTAHGIWSGSLHVSIEYEKGCALFFCIWNINKGALRTLPLPKHQDNAVWETKSAWQAIYN